MQTSDTRRRRLIESDQERIETEKRAADQAARTELLIVKNPHTAVVSVAVSIIDPVNHPAVSMMSPVPAVVSTLDAAKHPVASTKSPVSGSIAMPATAAEPDPDLR